MATKKDLQKQIDELKAEIEQLQARMLASETSLISIYPWYPLPEPPPSPTRTYPWYQFKTDDNTASAYTFMDASMFLMGTG